MAALVGMPASSLRNSRLCTLSKFLGRCLPPQHARASAATLLNRHLVHEQASCACSPCMRQLQGEPLHAAVATAPMLKQSVQSVLTALEIGQPPEDGLRVGALGQDVQQVGRRHKVEAREGHALGLQVVLQEGKLCPYYTGGPCAKGNSNAPTALASFGTSGAAS